MHLSFPVLTGVGGIAYATVSDMEFQSDWYVEDAEVFLVVEPGVELELNVTRFFRFAVGATYRFTSNIELMPPSGSPGVSSNVLNGFTFGATFKFGVF